MLNLSIKVFISLFQIILLFLLLIFVLVYKVGLLVYLCLLWSTPCLHSTTAECDELVGWSVPPQHVDYDSWDDSWLCITCVCVDFC